MIPETFDFGIHDTNHHSFTTIALMSLKVLMLGWEYPPHIAGGLGIACHGLSESLKEEGVQITFVVPHLSGDEDSSRINLVSASSVPIPLASTQKSVSTYTGGYSIDEVITETSKTIFVESTLSSYNLAHLEAESLSDIQHWNRKFFTETTEVSVGTFAADVSTYKFKGGYGKDLLKEVDRYADVVAEIARTQDFDIIHAHDWMTYPAGIAAQRVTGKPLVIHVHATEFDRAGDGGSEAVYNIERMAIERAERIIAVSKWTAEILKSKYNAAPLKINVVHNGVFQAKEPKSRSHSPISDKFVTFLGRVTFQKGPEYFVEAAKKVLEKFPGCHFIIAGSGDALPSIIDRVASAGMSRNFHFTGFLNKTDVDKLLSFTSIYVMPSVSEPFGITPLEAIQSNVPVIISKQSGVSEVIEGALKVDFWDTNALSNAICVLLKHGSLAEMLRKKAQQDLLNLTWNSAAKKVKQIYETVGTYHQ